MAALTFAESLAIVRGYPARMQGAVLLAMLLSGKQPNGTAIDLQMVAQLQAAEAIAVAGGGTVVRFSIPYSGTAYTAGDSIGGVFEIEDAVRNDGGAAIITSVTLSHADGSQATPAGKIYLFGEDPTINTADNAAVSELAADVARECNSIDIASGDWAARSTTYAICVKDQLYKTVWSTSGRSLWGLWKGSNTPDFTSTSGVINGVATLAYLT